MNDLRIERRRVARRRLLTTAVTGVCGLLVGATVFPKTAAAAGFGNAEMNSPELINALRSIGKPVCMDAADRLAASAGTKTGFDLHLRGAGLNEADARVLADGMLRSDAGDGPVLRSFSASYNPELGDTGAAALAEAFPETMTELGLVGCSIGDAGGRAILEWAQTAPKVRMICVEGNNFSTGMRSQFQDLAPFGRHVLVVV